MITMYRRGLAVAVSESELREVYKHFEHLDYAVCVGKISWSFSTAG